MADDFTSGLVVVAHEDGTELRLAGVSVPVLLKPGEQMHFEYGSTHRWWLTDGRGVYLPKPTEEPDG